MERPSDLFELALEKVTDLLGGHVILIRRRPAAGHWEIHPPKGLMIIVNLGETDWQHLVLEVNNFRDVKEWSITEEAAIQPAVSELAAWIESKGTPARPTALWYHEALAELVYNWGNPHVNIVDGDGRREARWGTKRQGDGRVVTLSLLTERAGGPILLGARIDGTADRKAAGQEWTLDSVSSVTGAGKMHLTPRAGVREAREWMKKWEVTPPTPDPMEAP